MPENDSGACTLLHIHLYYKEVKIQMDLNGSTQMLENDSGASIPFSIFIYFIRNLKYKWISD
jgi:hypothetical protein